MTRLVDESSTNSSQLERRLLALVDAQRSTAQTRATTSRSENGLRDVVVGAEIEPRHHVLLAGKADRMISRTDGGTRARRTL